MPKQRKELTIRLVGIIKRRIEIGIAVSVSETDFGQIDPPRWVRGGPYLFAALQVLAGVVSWADKYAYSGKISYFFEAGHKHQTITSEAIDMVRAKGSGHLRYDSHMFAGKRDLRPLQAADLLAYEWQKELRRINMPPVKRAMRRSLHSLLERSHITQHYRAEDLHLAFTEGHAALGDRLQRFSVVE